MSRTAIITGGARGIGLAIAESLMGKGIEVLIADIDGAQACASAQTLQQKLGVKAHGTACDITKRTDVSATVALAVERMGHIDILVNNAGICPFIEVMDMDEATFRRTIDINLIGAFLMTQEVGRRMIAQNTGGKVIFITSLSVNVTSSQQADYGASKAGLNMLMKGFSIALGRHGIQCNAVAPGIIYTDMGKSHWDKPENQRFIKDRVPVGRIGLPSDIGAAVAHLVAEDMAYVNGTSLIVDGGHQACCC